MSYPPSYQQPSWTSPQPEPSGPGGPSRRSGLTTGLIVAVVALIVALAASLTVAVVQSSRLSSSREDAQQLREQVTEQEQVIDDLQQQLSDLREGGGSAPGSGTDPLEDLSELEDLLGEDLGGMLGELEDLFGPEGPLGDLGDVFGDLGDLDLSADAADTSGCLEGITDLPDLTGSTVEQQVEEATALVEQIRGLRFPGPLDVEVLTSEQVAERIDQLVDEEYGPDVAEVDRAMLSALGAVPADIDLVQTQTELLGAQVAGFYDPDSQELVVRSDDPDQPLDTLGLITLVHELEHALADATVGLPELGTDVTDEVANEDGALAEIAVVEGDAVAVQTIATSVALSPQDLLDVFSDPQAILGAQEGLDEVPHYVAESLTFPYVAGPTFVCDAYAAGGWDAVDDLLSDPPATTAEVLYGSSVVPDAPARPDAPDGYELVERRTFGAAQLSWLFAAPGGDESLALSDPVEAARGWAGGEVTLLEAGDGEYAVVLSLVDGGGLCESVTEWWQRTEPAVAPQAGTVACMGEQVLVGVADTEAVASEAVGA